MDGREPDRSPEPGGRPLTRRELRAARAAGLDVPADTGELPAGADEAGAGPASTASPATTTGRNGTARATAHPADEHPAAGLPGEPARTEADSWEAAVGWALRGELPAALPPEPAEPDDVRWEQPALPRQPDGPDGPGHSGPAGPAGLPREHSTAPDRPDEAPDLDALARGLEPTRLPDVPADDRRPWDDSGLWAAEAGSAPVEGQPRRVSVFDRVEEHAGEPGAPDEDTAQRPAVPSEELTQPLAVPPPPGADESYDDGTYDHGSYDDGSYDDVVAPAPPDVDAGAGGPAPDGALPTLDDLLATRPAPADGPAEWGWRGAVRRMTGGLVAPAPGTAELLERESVAAVQRPLDGPRTIVVVNPKGGAHKTTASLLIAATFGRHRGGYTLAWDNNETRGTLGWRSRHTHHSRTAVDLLEDLDRFADPSSSRVGDLDAYVRSQASAQFDVLASDEDAASAASVDAFAFRALHRTLLRFYRVLVVDTGNNMRASNWQAALEAADQVVVVSTMREDTAQSAAWMLDALRATGHEDVVRRAVTVLSQPGPRSDAELTARLHDHFGRLTRAVLEVPYEPALVAGGPIDYDALAEPTRRAWLHVAAAVADGL